MHFSHLERKYDKLQDVLLGHSHLQGGSSVSVSEQFKGFRKFLKLTIFPITLPQISSEEAEKHSDQMRCLEGQVRDQLRH